MCAQSSKSRLGLKLVIVLAVLAVAAVFVRRTLRPVARVSLVTDGVATNSVPGSVLVAATRISPLTSEIGGRIQKTDLDPGKHVKEGDVLVQIDTGDIDLDIEKTRIDLDAAKKKFEAGSSFRFEYETALENLENADREHKRGSLSDQDLARQKRLVDSAKLKLTQEEDYLKQQISTLENSLKVKERQRSKMTIMAPFDGVVSAVYAHKDDQIGNNFSIATLITTTRDVEAKISEENFASIELNQRAIVHFLTYGDESYDAKVIKKLPTAEVGTQRYIALLEVNIPPEKLLPDLTGDVTIILAQRPTKTQFPRRAYFDGFVYVVNDGRVERRSVKLGYSGMNLAEAVSGLKNGEQVIVDELDQFHDGDLVRTEVEVAK